MENGELPSFAEIQLVNIILSSSSFRGLTPDQAIVDEHMAALASKLDGYEAVLSKQKYLAGDVSGSSLNICVFSNL